MRDNSNILFIDSAVSNVHEEKNKSKSWNVSSDLYLNGLKINDEAESKKRRKKDTSLNTNNCTLSLRIAAYENSVEAVAADTIDGKDGGVKKEKHDLKKQLCLNFLIQVINAV